MVSLRRLLEPAINGTDNFGEVERPNQSHVERPKPKESSWKNAAASKYTADMSKHAFLGTDPSLRPENQEYAEKL